MLAFAHTQSPPAAVRATQRSVGDCVTFTCITLRDTPFDEEKGKKRTEEKIRDLQKITGPHFRSMIAQEDFPALSTGACWANLLHILLDGPFTHPNI
jgi:hypothetical protein